MGVAITTSLSSALWSTVKFQYSSHKPILSLHYNHARSTSNSRLSSTKSNAQQKREGVVVQKKKQSKDERGNVAKPQQASSSKGFGITRNDKDSVFASNDQQFQVEPSNIQNAAFLNAVVKVKFKYLVSVTSLGLLHPYCPRLFTSLAKAETIHNAFMIGGRKLLTNAHCVEHDTQVKVKRRGDDTKYVAKVLARGVDCDIALLSVESDEFWREVEPLRFGRLPHLQVFSSSFLVGNMFAFCFVLLPVAFFLAIKRLKSVKITYAIAEKDSVTVVGYPLGGDTISVTKGVVSRIEVTSYAHGSSDLLGIQIDAAINPGNSGGPAFNAQGECIGVAFQVLRSDDAENIGYVIPTTVVSHFLTDYEKNGRYTGFASLGVLIQKLENPALRACLKVKSNEGVLVRRVEPTSDANNVLKEGDVIVRFDDVRVGCEGTVPFRSNERIAFHYLISQKFAGDTAELGIIRAGTSMNVKIVLNPRVHLVPYHIDEGQPSYLIIAGLVFTPLSEPLIEEECEDTIGLKLLAKARYSLARFEGEQIVILSQVLKLNGTRIKNIQHLAHLVDSCKDRYLYFEFEASYIAVLEREAVATASSCILADYGIPSERSPDLLKPYVNSLEGEPSAEKEFGDIPVSNYEIGVDGLFWA
ncbi:hypothetical protein Lal_00047069 [Lupinus albus]|nr:hypothetical protein Lal_00047069 [Lupinus albus]